MKFWKGQIYHTLKFIKKQTVSRAMIITSNLLHKRIKIHNGKIYRYLYVTRRCLFNKFGSFFFTKKKSSYLKTKIKKKRGKLKKK